MEKVKILKQTAAALMIAAISFTGCKKDDPVNVSGVNLNKTTLTLDVGATETLMATVTPADAENKAISWAVTGDVVTVDQNGNVTAVKEGTATVTVTTADGNFTATCAVTVQAAYEPVNPMILTTAISGEVEIQLAGTGTAIIDWGDGTEHEMVTLTEEPVDYYHNFTGTTSRTITIDGQNITHLHCGSMLLTAIDVSQYPFPRNTQTSIIY